MIFLRNRETLPPWENDVSIEGINITSSSEQTSGNYALSFGNLRQLSTPPCSTYQNNLLPTTWKWYSEEVFDVGCMYNKELLVNLSFICIMSQVYLISASLECVENLWLRVLKVTHNYFERDCRKKNVNWSRQQRKVLWVILQRHRFLISGFRENLRKGHCYERCCRLIELIYLVELLHLIDYRILRLSLPCTFVLFFPHNISRNSYKFF